MTEVHHDSFLKEGTFQCRDIFADILRTHAVQLELGAGFLAGIGINIALFRFASRADASVILAMGAYIAPWANNALEYLAMRDPNHYGRVHQHLKRALLGGLAGGLSTMVGRQVGTIP